MNYPLNFQFTLICTKIKMRYCKFLVILLESTFLPPNGGNILSLKSAKWAVKTSPVKSRYLTTNGESKPT